MNLGSVGSLFSPAVGIAKSGILHGLFGTDQGVINTTSSNSTSPWAPLQPYLTQAFGAGQSLFNGFSPQTQSIDAARALNQNTLAGNYLSPSSNPYLKSSVQDALGLAGSAFAGQYGGQAGSNLENSGYQEGLARTLGNVATNAYSNAYQQERGNQQAAMSVAPALDLAAMQSPWLGLQNYEAALSPGLGFNQSVGTNQTPYYQNNTANTLGALASAAGMAKMFSDRRLKSNVVLVDYDHRGFGIYEYDIFGQRQRGVMADEVEKVFPDVVSEFEGYKMVDYGRLYG